MLVLGLDPGLRNTGWGVIETGATKLRFVASGVVHGGAGDQPLADRLMTLHAALCETIERFQPGEAAVEETVVNVNALSSLKLGHARGVILLAAAQAGLLVREYASKAVKRAVTGTGAGTKDQVAMMVRTLLPTAGDVTADAADALAVAICHAHHRATELRLRPSIRAGA